MVDFPTRRNILKRFAAISIGTLIPTPWINFLEAQKITNSKSQHMPNREFESSHIEMLKKLSVGTQAILHFVVSLGANGLIFAFLSAYPHLLIVVALVYNVAQVLYAFFNTSYTVHLVQTGQLKVPPTPLSQ